MGANFICNNCDFKATKEQSILYHILLIHEAPNNSYTKLVDHNAVKYSCVQNDDKSSKANILKRHKTPTNEKKFKCKCDYKATTKFNLNDHIMTVHEKLKQFKCDQCDYKAARKFTLKMHIIGIHEKVKKYTCELCDYKGSKKYSLKIHKMSKHEGIKYSCKQCDFKATTQSNVNRHVKIIHETSSNSLKR